MQQDEYAAQCDGMADAAVFVCVTTLKNTTRPVIFKIERINYD